MKKARFYDQDPEIAASVELILGLPESLQPIFAECLIQLVERHCESDPLVPKGRPLDKNKVLALYKAKEKKRTYDRNPVVHKAFNQLAVIEESDRKALAPQVIEVVSVIEDYRKVCESANQPLNLQLVETMTRTYLSGGIQATRDYYQTMLATGIATGKPGAESMASLSASAEKLPQRQEVTGAGDGVPVRLGATNPDNMARLPQQIQGEPIVNAPAAFSDEAIVATSENAIKPTDAAEPTPSMTAAVPEADRDTADPENPNRNIKSAVRQIGKELKIKGDII